MNPFLQKKVLIFGLLGVAGCLGGWAVGEGLLAAGLPARESKTGRAAPSLASRPEPPAKIERQKIAPLPAPEAPAIPKRDPSLPAVAPPSAELPILPKRSPPPPLPPEYEVRSKKSGAKDGQVRMVLFWNNRNDLDLHCIDPFREEIFYSHKVAKESGGHLDVDRNVNGETNEPIENIYFPEGRAPLGRYQVWVRHYRNHGAADPTEYKAYVYINDQRLEFSGKITFDNTQPRQLIHEFFLTGLRIAAPPEISLYPGGSNKFRIRLERDRNDKPVTITFAGEAAGLKLPDKVTIPGNRDDAEIEVTAAADTTFGPRQVKIVGDNMHGKIETECKIIVKEPPANLMLGAPKEIALYAGGKNSMRIRVERDRDEPVTLTFTGELTGLKLPREVVVPAGKNEAIVEVAAEPKTTGGSRNVRVSGEWKHGKAETTCQFTVKIPPPVLHFTAPKEVNVIAGGNNRMTVRIAREHFEDPVRIRAVAERTGITLSEVVIPANEEEAEIEITAGAEHPEVVTGVTLTASAGALLVPTKLNVSVTVPPPPPEPVSTWSWRMVLVIGLWTALLAIGLSLALVIGQNRYLARPWLTGRQALIIIAGGGLAGLVAGGIGQALFALLAKSEMMPQIGFLAGWLLLGGLLGRGVVFFIPNLSAWRASLAGVVGGLIGASAFILVSRLGDVPGRLVGASILGFFIGLMVALVEVAFRKAWLEVRYGERESISVNLGAEPIKIGGDGKACTVWARGAAPIALRFWIRSGRVVCEDVVTGKTEDMPDGARRQAGNVELIVHSGVSGPSKSPPSRPTEDNSSRTAKTLTKEMRPPPPPPSTKDAPPTSGKSPAPPPPRAGGSTMIAPPKAGGSPPPPPPKTSSGNICPHCMAKVSVGARICMACGEDL